MRLLHKFKQDTVLSTLNDSLTNLGGRLLIGAVGYWYSNPALSEEFAVMLEKWLSGDSIRRASFFIGDRTGLDKAGKTNPEASVPVAGIARTLAKIGDGSCLPRISVNFVPALHAKFFAMYSGDGKNLKLEWLIIGSSNFSPTALQGVGIELDVLLTQSTQKLDDLDVQLRQYLAKVIEQTEDTELYDQFASMLENEIEKESDKRERKKQTKQRESDRLERIARAESDRIQGIEGNS